MADFCISREGWILEGPFLREKEERNPIPPGGRYYTESPYKYAGTFNVHRTGKEGLLLDIYFDYPHRTKSPMVLAFSNTEYDGCTLGQLTIHYVGTDVLRAGVCLFEDYMKSIFVPWWSFATS